MFILGIAVGLHIAILAFAYGFNKGIDQAGELKRFNDSKAHRLSEILEKP